MTDEFGVYTKLGREFASHQSVDHSRGEYAYYAGQPTGRFR